MTRARLGVALAAACLLAPGQALAQTDGLFLGGAVGGISLAFEDANGSDTGVGVSATVGYGFGIAAPYLKLSIAQMSMGREGNADGSYSLRQLDLGARATFEVGSVLPYVDGAFTVQRARFEELDEVATFKGSGFTFGAGVLFPFDAVALDLALDITRGEFGEVESEGESFDLGLGNTTARVDIGMVYRTGGGS